jgi:hypothetical protein
MFVPRASSAEAREPPGQAQWGELSSEQPESPASVFFKSVAPKGARLEECTKHCLAYALALRVGMPGDTQMEESAGRGIGHFPPSLSACRVAKVARLSGLLEA